MTDYLDDAGSPADDDGLLPEGEGQPIEDGAQGEGQGQPRRRPNVQGRIDDITRERRAAERRAEAAEAELAKLTGGPNRSEQPDPNAEPDPSRYDHGENDSRYIRDLGAYGARQAMAAERSASEFASRKSSLIERGKTFSSEHQAGVTKLLTDTSLPVTPLIAEVVLDSDPALAAHLGNNPSEIDRIARLPPLKQALELARLEARLTADAAGSPPPPKVSNAPEPPASMARGNGGRFAADPSKMSFVDFEKHAQKIIADG